MHYALDDANPKELREQVCQIFLDYIAAHPYLPTLQPDLAIRHHLIPPNVSLLRAITAALRPFVLGLSFIGLGSLSLASSVVCFVPRVKFTLASVPAIQVFPILISH